MIDWLATHAGISGLLFFFFVFSGVIIWAYRPSMKESLEAHKFIPLEEDK